MIRYSLPLFAASLFQQLYTMADAIILGQYAGKMGLASIDAILNLPKLPANFLIGDGNIKGVGYLPTSVLARYPREDGGVRRRRYAFKIDKDVYDSKKVHKLYL